MLRHDRCTLGRAKFRNSLKGTKVKKLCPSYILHSHEKVIELFVYFISIHCFLELAINPSPNLWQAAKKMFCQTPLIPINPVSFAWTRRLLSWGKSQTVFFLKSTLFQSCCMPINRGWFTGSWKWKPGGVVGTSPVSSCPFQTSTLHAVTLPLRSLTGGWQTKVMKSWFGDIRKRKPTTPLADFPHLFNYSHSD